MSSHVAILLIALMHQQIQANDGKPVSEPQRESAAGTLDPIPKNLFKLRSFTSTNSKEFSSLFKKITEGETDSPKELDHKYVIKISEATWRLFQTIRDLSYVDKEFIETRPQYIPIATWKSENQIENYLILIMDEALRMTVLYQFDGSINKFSATRISGWLCAGPIAMDETLLAHCREEVSTLKNDTLKIVTKYKASYQEGNKKDIIKTGSLLLRIQFNKNDTLSTSGIYCDSSFIHSIPIKHKGN